MAVVRLIFRFCTGNHPMGVRFAAGNHPTAVRFVARNHPTGVRFAARNHPTGVRFVARNHPSGRSASSSPQGAPLSHLMFALSATQTEGWFPVQSLKINRARPVKRADGEHRPLQMICNVCGAGWMGGNY